LALFMKIVKIYYGLKIISGIIIDFKLIGGGINIEIHQRF
jgi:hypothetical protein